MAGNNQGAGLNGAVAEADSQFSSQPVSGAAEGCVQDIQVSFNDTESDLQELWDLWIEEQPAESIARFDIVTDPPHYSSIQFAGEVEGPSGVVNSHLSVDPPAASSTLCSVHWDGRDDAGNKVPTGTYRIRLTASSGSISANDLSTEIKVLRVGVLYIRFRNVYPLKFAFRDYPAAFDSDDFDVPPAEWRISSLDEGEHPRTPPVCSTQGRSADTQNYCYPIAAKKNACLIFRVGTEGSNYASGDGIRIRVVQTGTETAWSNDVASNIDNHQEYWFEANDGNRLNHCVSKRDDLHFDFLFEYTNSGNQVIRLGRQRCSCLVVYVIVSMPTDPWGLGNAANRQRPWVELLEKVCTDWAQGAQTVEEAAGMIVVAVNDRMGLRYDTASGADVNNLVTKTGGVPNTIQLRAFLRWIGSDPARPSNWNVLNCTCCGALVSTIANVIGCSICSSVMTDDFWNGFNCNQIISIGFSNWDYPFPNATHTAGGFSYHEVAWTGSAGASDDIYDACLQVASDPVNAPATNPLYVRGMVYESAASTINDYERRLVHPGDVANVRPHDDRRGRYRPN